MIDNQELNYQCNRLRRLPGWQTKGEPYLSAFLKWVREEDLTLTALDSLVASYLATNTASLHATQNHVEALRRRWGDMQSRPRSTKGGTKWDRLFGDCEVCGDPAAVQGWAGRYCTRHYVMPHMPDVQAGLLGDYPTGENCDRCTRRWVTWCRLGVFCHAHSVEAITRCMMHERGE